MAGPVQSIERAAAILRLLAGGSRRLGLGEVASSLGLAKGTAHGILRTLQHVDFVEQDPATGKYQLGAALLHLGTSTPWPSAWATSICGQDAGGVHRPLVQLGPLEVCGGRLGAHPG
ncbi:helix-turn-helix domain-containing protein, partial [Streptomyces nigra]